uniref:hypothetical protein n=1 Tax=Cohaesibacter celericrescens TaxID=2067669 RepID=UPI003567D699
MIPLRKWLLRGLYTVVVLLLLVVVAVLFLLATSPGRSLTVGLVNNLASSDDQKVELVGLESVMGALQLSALRLSDKQGVWLEAKGLSADYSLSDLLMLRFSANHITLEQLAIKRAPQATDAPAPTESGPLLPDIPAIRAQIDDIAIKSIQIDETLLGIPASLSLSGKLTLEDQPLRLSGALDILHTDGGNGYVKASWDFIPVQNRRKINISLFGPRGGLAARLMAMKDLPAIQVTLVGDGSADDWQSQLSVSLDEKPMIGGQLTARLANGTRRIEAQLDGTLAPFVPQSLLPLVAGKSQLTLSAEQIGDTKLTLPQFSFTSELASLKAVGTVDLTENTLDVSTRFQLGQEGTHIALEQPQGAPLYLGLVDLAARIHGPMSQAALQLQGSVAHIGSGQTLIEKTTVSATSNTFDVGNGTGPIKALFAIEQVATGSDPLDRMVRGPITLSIDSTLGGSSVDLTKAKLDAGLLSAVFQGVLSAKELALDGTFTLRDLDVIEPDLAGALSGELAIKGTAQAPALTLSVEGDALSVANKAIEGLQLKISADATPNAALALTARYAGAPLEIKADLTSDTDGNKQIENIVINAPDTQVKGAVSLSPTGLASGVLDAEISDFKQLGALLLQPDLEGALKAKITLSDENDRQMIALEAVAPQIITKDLSLAGLALNARIVDPSKSMAVDAKLDMGDLRAGGEQLRQFSARMVGQDGSLPFSVTALFS